MSAVNRLVALTRPVSPAIERCELTHLPRRAIDYATACLQHRAYERTLEAIGCAVSRLPAAPDLPDSVFVEDTAVVLDEVAILARPGAPGRRGEVPEVASALREHRPLRAIRSPGTLDGGDVLCVGRTLFVGASGRTNSAGFAQLKGHLEPLGYRVRRVAIDGCLHLKTAVTEVDDGLLLVNPDWIDVDALDGWERLEVDPREPFGANALRIGDTVVYPAAHPRTRARLEGMGCRIRTVEVSELAKAEGGVTCCCLVVRDKKV